jgi:hypothetical protein
VATKRARFAGSLRAIGIGDGDGDIAGLGCPIDLTQIRDEGAGRGRGRTATLNPTPRLQAAVPSPGQQKFLPTAPPMAETEKRQRDRMIRCAPLLAVRPRCV